MDIFYTASYYGKATYQNYYDLVLQAIEKCGVSLVSPEKGNYLELVSDSEKKALGSDKLIHYEAIRRGIAAADAVIIEISHEDFQLGHEATLAISGKKHVLCLSTNEDFSEKISNKYFHGAKYDESNVNEVVRSFIERVKGEGMTERFNMFLPRNLVVYLERVARSRGINKSEYIRMLIEKDRQA